MKFILLTIINIFIFYGCAQFKLHRGTYAVQVNKTKGDREPASNSGGISFGYNEDEYLTSLGLLISAEIDTIMSNRNFGFIRITIENTSDKWIRINKASLSFGSKIINNNVRFVSGNQLSYYLDAVKFLEKEKNKVIAQNQAAWTGFAAGLAATAATVNNSSGQSSQYNSSLSINLGLINSLSISQMIKNRKKLKSSEIFPKGHLLHKDFVIPPGLFVRKWIVFNTTKHEKIGFLQKAFFRYKSKKGRTEKVVLFLRDKGTSDVNFKDNWMSDVISIPQYGTEERMDYDEGRNKWGF